MYVWILSAFRVNYSAEADDYSDFIDEKMVTGPKPVSLQAFGTEPSSMGHLTLRDNNNSKTTMMMIILGFEVGLKVSWSSWNRDAALSLHFLVTKALRSNPICPIPHSPPLSATCPDAPGLLSEGYN